MAQNTDSTSDFMNDEDIYEFFKQLWFIINDKDNQYFHVIKWMKDGNAFRIVEPEKFYKEICPMICKGCTREYFEYVIFACNFEVVPSVFLEFRNSYFVQHEFERLKNLKPEKPIQSLRVFSKLSKTSSSEENSDYQVSSTSGDDFLLDAVASELRKPDDNSNCQISSTSDENSISDVGTSELRNTDENSDDQVSSTSEKCISLDVGACASVELLKKPSKEFYTVPKERTSYSKDEMDQDDIYNFFKELWNIISNDEFEYYSVVRWIKSGRLFRITDTTKFDEEVIPKLCESCTTDYFEYVLFACGFESIPPNFMDFYHKDFLEDNFKRLEEIKPKTSVMTPKAFLKLTNEDLQRNQNNPRISSMNYEVSIGNNSSSSEDEPDTTDLKNKEPSQEKDMIYIDLLAEAAKSTKTASNTLVACALNVDQEVADNSPISSLSSPEDIETPKN